MRDEMSSEAQEKLLPSTRKSEFSFSALFRQLSKPSKRYTIGRLAIWLNRDFAYPVTFSFGPEASIELEVSRKDVVNLISIIENSVLSDTENKHKLRQLGFWEGLKLILNGKADKEFLLSSDLLSVRRVDGFWLLINSKFMGRCHGDSYSEREWRQLVSVLTESLSESSQSEV